MRVGSKRLPPPSASGVSAHIRSASVNMKSSTTYAAVSCDSEASRNPSVASAERKYAPAPTAAAIKSEAASASSTPTVAATLPATAFFERIEFRNSAHFNHTRAKS